MSKINPQATVGQLVAEQPGRSRVFDRLDIDFCCGGKQPLEQVCRKKNLNVEDVVRQLEQEDGATGESQTVWAEASLSDLADHIEQVHHAYLKRELPRLRAMVRKVTAVHGANHPWLLELDGVYASFAAEMESHALKEEGMLFPMIRDLDRGRLTTVDNCGGSVSAPINAMEHEHDDAAEAMRRMRELSNGYTPPSDACNTFRAMLSGLAEVEADTHRHVHKENSILFPRAAKVEAQLRDRLCAAAQ